MSFKSSQKRKASMADLAPPNYPSTSESTEALSSGPIPGTSPVETQSALASPSISFIATSNEHLALHLSNPQIPSPFQPFKKQKVVSETEPVPSNHLPSSEYHEALGFGLISSSTNLGTLPTPATPSASSSTTVGQLPTPHPWIPPLTIPGPVSTSDFLENSHHNVFNNPTMVSVSNTFDSGGGAIMQLLESKTIRGAEHDSSARYPPPNCHPETRKGLRGEIVHWVSNPRRGWRMFYVLGPAGVGKSAIAQTVADETDCLGASCFISRPNGRNDPNGVIPTLAYQLAVKHNAYKRIISLKIGHDPTILRKSRRVQFKELLVDPFHIIMTKDPSAIQTPLLIIIDGLDECRDKEAQCEFIELIGDHARSFPEFPLLWLICSRPESHLKCKLSQVDFQVTCRREEISVNDEEGRQDVLLYLRDAFRTIRSKHPDVLDTDWPPENHLLRIATAASGLFAFASTVVRFVGDADVDDPPSQLRVCMKALASSRTPVGQNPYLTLDLLYQHILSSIRSAIRPTTMRILGMSILYPGRGPIRSVQGVANFFLIGKAAFYRALKPLHSVIRVPSSSDAFTNSIEFYHASFADFLRDPERSGDFRLDEAAVHHDVALTVLRWHTGLGREIQEDDLWVSPSEGAQTCLQSTKSQSLNILWNACCHLEGENAVNVYQELHSFDFNLLRNHIPMECQFDDFLNWLSEQASPQLGTMLFKILDYLTSGSKFFNSEAPKPSE